ncbi:hypothetical protein VNI00_017544 [Paramarasmius palmivorus]|uniref:RNA helicase n=1 Tax=Paramarasmius palmivorus TaxID=297713 RepID=A0AAW0B4S5_9AGAR
MEQPTKRRRIERSPSPTYKLDDEDDYEPYIPVAQRRQAKLAKLSSLGASTERDRIDKQREEDELEEENREEERRREKSRKERTLLLEAQEVHSKKAAEDAKKTAEEKAREADEEILEAIKSRRKLASDLELAKGIQYTESLKTRSEEQHQKLREKYHIIVEGVDVPPPIEHFSDMKIPDSVLQHIKSKRITKPTPILLQGIPAAYVFLFIDLLHAAQVYHRKTLDFCMPLIMLALEEEVKVPLVRGEGPVGVIRCPSRELANQTYEKVLTWTDALAQDGKYPRLNTLLCMGGISMNDQSHTLSKGLHIVVATPGRLIDMLEKKRFTFNNCKYLCMDEADRMIDLGFEDDVRNIMSFFKRQRQTLLFSATMPRKIQDFAQQSLIRPVLVNVGRAGAANLDVLQVVEYVKQEAKMIYLLKCLQKTPPPVIIFSENKNEVDDIQEYLLLKGVEAVAIHGSNSKPLLSCLTSSDATNAGGVYDFYSISDEISKLAWSEFIFSDALSPINDFLLESVEPEVRQNIRRVNRHPSVAQWAGGNEIEDFAIATNTSLDNGTIYLNEFVFMFQDFLHDIALSETRSVPYTDCSTTRGGLSLDPYILRLDNKSYGNLYGNSERFDYDASRAFDYSTYPVSRFHSTRSFYTWQEALTSPEDFSFNPTVVMSRDHHPPASGLAFPNPNAPEGQREMTEAVEMRLPRPGTSHSNHTFAQWCYSTQVFQALTITPHSGGHLQYLQLLLDHAVLPLNISIHFSRWDHGKPRNHAAPNPQEDTSCQCLTMPASKPRRSLTFRSLIHGVQGTTYFLNDLTLPTALAHTTSIVVRATSAFHTDSEVETLFKLLPWKITQLSLELNAWTHGTTTFSSPHPLPKVTQLTLSTSSRGVLPILALLPNLRTAHLIISQYETETSEDISKCGHRSRTVGLPLARSLTITMITSYPTSTNTKNYNQRNGKHFRDFCSHLSPRGLQSLTLEWCLAMCFADPGYVRDGFQNLLSRTSPTLQKSTFLHGANRNLHKPHAFHTFLEQCSISSAILQFKVIPAPSP